MVELTVDASFLLELLAPTRYLASAAKASPSKCHDNELPRITKSKSIL
jgi:hypothetical protein